jgi:hypothetical protein
MTIKELIKLIIEYGDFKNKLCKYLTGVLTDNLYLYVFTTHSTITSYSIPNGTADEIVNKINSLQLEPETPVLVTDHLNDLGYIMTDVLSYVISILLLYGTYRMLEKFTPKVLSLLLGR